MLKVLKLALWRMQQRGCQVFFVEGFSKTPEDWPFSDRAKKRFEHERKFHELLREPEASVDDLRDLFREKYSPGYLECVTNPTTVSFVGNRWCSLDTNDDFFTVVGGKRIAIGQPRDAEKTVHIFCGCTIAGPPWIENADTVPTLLQVKLKESGLTRILVDNCGIRGAGTGITNTMSCLIHNLALDSMSFGADDVVVIYGIYYQLLTVAQELGLDVFDIAQHLPHNEITASDLVDSPSHLGFAFNGLVADAIGDYLLANDLVQPARMLDPGLDKSLLFDHLKEDAKGDLDDAARIYVREILDKYGDAAPDARVGAIMMNANPFTLGHRHLVEWASSRVDRLYVFVVQEDRSDLPFEDRLALVRAGTADFTDVIVVPSGRCIVSAETWPEYFVRENEPDLVVDPTVDIRAFGTLIAPGLGITERFFGEEKVDFVTAQYNEAMARLLPEYGIQFVEIPRLCLADGLPISAKKVRELASSQEWDCLESYVPEDTLAYLKGRHSSRR